MSNVQFSPFRSVGEFQPLQLTPEQKTFFSAFLGRVLDVVAVCDRGLSESLHELFKGAMAQILKEEEDLNRRHWAHLKAVERSASPRDPMAAQKYFLKLLWSEQYLADDEAGRKTIISLRGTQEGKEQFTLLRKVHYCIEYAKSEERQRVFGVLDQIDKPSKEIPKEMLGLREQVSSVSLRKAFLFCAKRDFALKHKLRMPREEEAVPGKLDPQLVNSIALLVFESLDRIDNFGTQTDLKIACQLALIHFRVEAIFARFLSTRPESLDAKDPAELLKDFTAMQKLFDKSAPAVSGNEGKNFSNFFGLVKTAPPSKDVQRPIFKVKNKEWIAFAEEWRKLNEGLVKLSEFLSERSRKGANQLGQPPTPRAKQLTREISFAPHLYVKHASPRHERNETTLQIKSLLEQACSLMQIFTKEFKALPQAPNDPLPKEKTSSAPAVFDPMHPDLDKTIGMFQEVVDIFEGLVMYYVSLNDNTAPTRMMALFFEHLEEMEKNENQTILKGLEIALNEFEAKNSQLQATDPTLYAKEWAKVHFQTELKLGTQFGAAGRHPLPLVKELPSTLMDKRYFRRILNQKYTGGFPEISVEAFIETIAKMKMKDFLRINSGHETIQSQNSSPEANVINDMMLFLADARKDIYKRFNVDKVPLHELPKRLENVTDKEYDLLWINALSDVFAFLQNVHKRLSSLKNASLVPPARDESNRPMPKDPLQQLLEIEKEFGATGSRIAKGSQILRTSSQPPVAPISSEAVNDVRMIVRGQIEEEKRLLIGSGEKIWALVQTHLNREVILKARVEQGFSDLRTAAQQKAENLSSLVLEHQDKAAEAKMVHLQIKQQKGMSESLSLCMSLIEKITARLLAIPSEQPPSRSSGFFGLRSSGLVSK